MTKRDNFILKLFIAFFLVCMLFFSQSIRSLAASSSDTAPLSDIVVHYTAQIVSGDENQIWSQPYPVTGSTWVASAKSYNGQYVNIVREARTSTGTYEQFQVNGQTIGWLDRKAFQSFADDTYADNPVNLIGQVIPGNGNQVWSQPYDVRGSTWTANQSSFSGQWVKIVREAQTIRGTYYQFEVNSRVIGWMDKSAFQSVNDNTYSAQEVHYTAQIKSGDGNQVWASPFPVDGGTWVASQSSFNGQWIRIINQAATPAGKYYQFQANGRTIGWMDTNAFQSLANDTYYNNAVNYVGKVISGSGNQVWSEPYDVRGSAWTANQSSFSGQWVKIIRQAQTVRGTYYQFEENGRVIGWMDKSAFQSVASNTYSNQQVNLIAQIIPGTGNQIWASPFPLDGGRWVANQSNYNNQWIKIVNEATTETGTYYQIQSAGKTIGWLDKNAFQLVHNNTYNSQQVNLIGKVIPGAGNQIWGSPFPVDGGVWLANQSNYSGQWAKITSEATTETGTYYQFQIAGKEVGWMDTSAFESVTNNTYSNESAHYTAQIKGGTGNQIWASPFPVDGGSWVGNQSSYGGQWVNITNKVQTVAGSYYQFQSGSGQTIGWMDTSAFQSLADDTYYNKQVNYVARVLLGNTNQVWSLPYNVRNCTWVGSQGNYTNQWVNIVREAQTEHGTYYQFAIAGKVIGWMDKNAFGSLGETYYDNPVSILGQISASSTDGIWGSPYAGGGTAFITSGSSYNGQLVQIIREAQTTYGTYEQFAINGKTVGWLDKKAFSFDYSFIDLRKSSTITAQDIVNFFNRYSPGSPLKNDAQTFIDAQNTYGVNAQYLLAHAIWETGWGEHSELYTYKHNLYGYGAFDIAPFTCGYYYPSDAESINYAASQIRSNYLNPDGIYYDTTYGPTLQGLNVHYASDQNWKNGIAEIMQEIIQLDSSYYANASINSSPMKDGSTYGSDIPAGQPIPSDINVNLPAGTYGTVVNTSEVNLRSLPYVSTGTYLQTVALGTKVSVLGYSTDVIYDPTRTDSYAYRWYRVNVNGVNGWINGEYLTIN